MREWDGDTYTVFGTEYSKREVFTLEAEAGKTTLAGDCIRFADARSKFAQEFGKPFKPLLLWLQSALTRKR